MRSTDKVQAKVWLTILIIFLSGAAPWVWAASPAGQKAVRQPSPRQVIVLPWGKGPGQAGKLIREEGAAEGPQSLAVGAHGEVFLLDQLNVRIIHLAADGTVLDHLPIPVAKPECQEGAAWMDIAVSADGKILLLDNLVGHCLVLLDQAGILLHHYDLAIFGIPVRPGEQAVGNMMLVEDELYVEDLKEGNLRRLLDRAGQPVPNDRFPGLPYKQGKQFILARIDVNKKAHRLTMSINEYQTGQTLKSGSWLVKDHAYLLANSVDQQNRIHLVYATFPTGKKPPVNETITWLRFDEHLREIARRIMVCPEQLPLDRNVTARITPTGELYMMHFTKRGVEIRRYE